MSNPPAEGGESLPTEGFLRFKQIYGKPVKVSGFAKYLPASSEKFHIRVHEFAMDDFKDCTSTGAIDSTNPAGDLAILETKE